MRRAGFFVRRIRQQLQSKASPGYTRQMQRFFKAPVRAYGWRTAEVRKLAGRLRREIGASADERLLFAVAERLFRGPTLEENGLGIFLLQPLVPRFSEPEFRRLERWLSAVTHWAACDGLAGWLLGPLIAADVRCLPRVFHWARSRNRWYRRGAAVSLIPAAQQGLHSGEVLRLADRLLPDKDDMVQKGVGWLLKEFSESRRSQVVKYLMRVRDHAPRLTLRIACEKLPARQRRRILS